MTTVVVLILVAAAALVGMATEYARRLLAAQVALLEALRPVADGNLTAKINIPAGRRGAQVADLVSAIADRLAVGHPSGRSAHDARTLTGEQNPDSRYIWVTLECVEIET
jgi:HAMP domain-containing protein